MCIRSLGVKERSLLSPEDGYAPHTFRVVNVISRHHRARLQNTPISYRYNPTTDQ